MYHETLTIENEKRMSDLQHEARYLSAGTFATLTDVRDYVTLDVIRTEFIRYCDNHPEFEHWQAAWRTYINSPHAILPIGNYQ